MKIIFIFSLLTGFLGSAFSQLAVDSERARIAAERSRAQAAFAVEDNACYKRFWVNACLDEVKAWRNDVLADLRRQEVALNDQERKAQGAEQLRKIEEKQTLAQQQAQADARAVAENKTQSKNEKAAQKTQGLLSPETALAAKAKANKANAADRLVANQIKLAGRNEKQALGALEAQKFIVKQQRAKERLEKNRAEQIGKPKSPPLPPEPGN